MEKTIKITQTDNGHMTFTITSFSQMEALGLLRFYEKFVWLAMQTEMAAQNKVANDAPKLANLPMTEKGYKVTEPKKTTNES